MANKVVIVQNDERVDAGFLIEVLETTKTPYVIVKATEPSLPQLSEALAVVTLGGRQGAYELDQHPFLVAEIEYMRAAIAKNIPVLGLCLGSQLLAVALGGTAFRAASSELGFASSFSARLTAKGVSECTASSLLPVGHPVEAGTSLDENLFFFHSDTFTLPPTCDVLAETDHYIAVCSMHGFLSLFSICSFDGMAFILKIEANIPALPAVMRTRRAVSSRGHIPQRHRVGGRLHG